MCEWHVIYGREEFFNATKVMHNALQGNPQDLTEEQWEIWERYNKINAEQLSDGWDVCIIHDPQPAAIASLVPGQRAQLGLALPHRPLNAEPRDAFAAAAVSASTYPASVFHMQQYVPDGSRRPRPHRAAGDRPAGAQEHGVLARGRRLHLRPVRDRRRPAAALPGVALRSVEGPARRDRRLPDRQGAGCPTCSSRSSARWRPTTPRGGTSSTATVAHADGDPDIHILNNLNNVGAIEVNAFQSHSDVVIQKSTREGFGLTVSEAIWKARPFIGGDVGGIPLQIDRRRVRLPRLERRGVRATRARDPRRTRRSASGSGGAGKERVRQRFLTPRLLRDWLKLFEDIGT